MDEKHYTIKNDGTDEDPSWAAYDHEDNWITDSEDLMEVVAQAEMFARANEVTKIIIELKAD